MEVKMKLEMLLLGATVCLFPVAIFGGNLTVNEIPEIDEAVYCNQEFEWGKNCLAKVECHGRVDGALFIQHVVYPYYGSFLNIGWGFEYDPGNGAWSALCEGWDTQLRAPWNPDFDMKCKGPPGSGNHSFARVHVDLTICEFDWVEP
jgi:hypothetical protein